MIENNSIKKILDDKKLDVKERIIKAAILEFAMNSIESAHIRAITKASNTNIAAVNYHFQNKENLYIRILSDLSEYMDNFLNGYSAEYDGIIKSKSRKAAKVLISKILIDSIDRFSQSQITSSLVLIFLREAITQGNGSKYISEAMYFRPIKMLAALMRIAGSETGRKEKYTVFAQSLWSNIHSYCSANTSLLFVHKWKQIGKKELGIIEDALNESLTKVLGI